MSYTSLDAKNSSAIFEVISLWPFGYIGLEKGKKTSLKDGYIPLGIHYPFEYDPDVEKKRKGHGRESEIVKAGEGTSMCSVPELGELLCW